MTRLAIAPSGGGTACAYFVGWWRGFRSVYPEVPTSEFDTSSGNGPNAAFITAGLQDRMDNIWEYHQRLATRKFISLGRRIIDIRYLVYDIFTKQEPLDPEAYYASPIDCHIAARNVRTGAVRWFSNRSRTDVFKVLEATCAMPVAYGRTVEIDGEEYMDLSPGIGECVAKAQEHGCTHIIAVDNSPHLNEDARARALLHFWSLTKSDGMCSAVDEYMSRPTYESCDPSVLVVRPSEPLPVGALDRRQEHLDAAIALGEHDAHTSHELATFVERFQGGSQS